MPVPGRGPRSCSAAFTTMLAPLHRRGSLFTGVTLASRPFAGADNRRRRSASTARNLRPESNGRPDQVRRPAQSDHDTIHPAALKLGAHSPGGIPAPVSTVRADGTQEMPEQRSPYPRSARTWQVTLDVASRSRSWCCCCRGGPRAMSRSGELSLAEHERLLGRLLDADCPVDADTGELLLVMTDIHRRPVPLGPLDAFIVVALGPGLIRLAGHRGSSRIGQ